MKGLIVKIFLLFIVPSWIFGQETTEDLMGYWIEQGGDPVNTLSTLLVFEKGNTGQISGKLYFLESEDEHQAFKLRNIQVSDQSFSFYVEHTSISFYGQYDPKTLKFSGAYYLDDDLVIEAVHQKLDPVKARRIEKHKRLVPKKHIDHTSGILIG